MKENKTINIIFRVSPRYKEYILMLAKRSNATSVSNYFNLLVAMETQKTIYEMANEEALKKAARELGIPENVGLTLKSLDDQIAVLGEEKAIRFSKIVAEELRIAPERIAKELNFDGKNEYDCIVDN